MAKRNSGSVHGWAQQLLVGPVGVGQTAVRSLGLGHAGKLNTKSAGVRTTPATAPALCAAAGDGNSVLTTRERHLVER